MQRDRRTPSLSPRHGLHEEIRLRYFYQDLILRGKAQISRDAAKALLGPDRAFHLYALPKRGAPRRR